MGPMKGALGARRNNQATLIQSQQYQYQHTIGGTQLTSPTLKKNASELGRFRKGTNQIQGDGRYNVLAKNVEDLNTQLFRPSSQMLTSAQSKNRKKVAAFGSGAG